MHKGSVCPRTGQNRAVDGVGRMRGRKSLEDPNTNQHKAQGTIPLTHAPVKCVSVVESDSDKPPLLLVGGSQYREK